MKILKSFAVFAAGLILMIGCSKSDSLLNQQSLNDIKLTGNGAPSGTHFNLNIIGVQKEKEMDLISGGNVIFVPLVGRCKIMLTEGEYGVLDKNGTDGEAAFRLPNPDPENDGVTVYSVWARAVGTPGGKATMQTGAIDPGLDGILGTADDITVYSMYYLEVERTQGKQRFTDVSKYLLYIYVESDIISDPDGIPNSGDEVVLVSAGRYPLFDPALEDYFWQYDNNGLKVLQLRFYEVPVTVPAQ